MINGTFHFAPCYIITQIWNIDLYSPLNAHVKEQQWICEFKGWAPCCKRNCWKVDMLLDLTRMNHSIFSVWVTKPFTPFTASITLSNVTITITFWNIFLIRGNTCNLWMKEVVCLKFSLSIPQRYLREGKDVHWFIALGILQVDLD